MSTSRNLRRGLSALTATALCGALAACGSGGEGESSADTDTSAANEKVTIDFWSWVPGIQGAVDLWNSENPDVQVKLTEIAAADQAKLATAVDAGTGPCVAQISQHQLPDFILNDRAVDITGYLGDAEDQFTESSWGVSTFDGKVYAVPQDTGPLGLYYRKDFFEQHHIPVPKTWEEFEAAAAQVRAADPNASITAFTPNEPGQWYSLLWQTGGSWFGIDGDTWQVDLNGPESQQLAEYWQGLLDKGLVPSQQMWGPDFWAAVNKGQIVTLPAAAWFANVLETNVPDLAGKWAVAPLPRWEGEDATGDTGGAVNPVLKGCDNPEQASQFALWLNTDPESLDILIEDGGLFPASTEGLARPVLDEGKPYYGGQKIFEVFQAEAKKVPSTWVEGPTFNQVTTDLADALGRVAAGTSTLQQELDKLQETTISRLTDQGLNAESAN
jgi:multiple sugar transport system substrate-binding protein